MIYKKVITKRGKMESTTASVEVLKLIMRLGTNEQLLRVLKDNFNETTGLLTLKFPCTSRIDEWKMKIFGGVVSRCVEKLEKRVLVECVKPKVINGEDIQYLDAFKHYYHILTSHRFFENDDTPTGAGAFVRANGSEAFYRVAFSCAIMSTSRPRMTMSKRICVQPISRVVPIEHLDIWDVGCLLMQKISNVTQSKTGRFVVKEKEVKKELVMSAVVLDGTLSQLERVCGVESVGFETVTIGEPLMVRDQVTGGEVSEMRPINESPIKPKKYTSENFLKAVDVDLYDT